MSELHNPLFDEEKEFLERKKLEYERALRGDVEHIKEQSATVGRVAAVGAGLAGTVWLITKAFGGKKRHHAGQPESGDGKKDSKGRKAKEKDKRKSASASAQVFMDDFEGADHEFGGGLSHATGPRAAQAVGNLSPQPVTKPTSWEPASSARPAMPAPAPKAAPQPAPPRPVAARADSRDDDPFQDLPYDDSRRLPAARGFDNDSDPAKGEPTAAMAAVPSHSMARVVGSVLQQFLQSDTGKVLVAQAGALALAAVTKKAGEFFPADKNADLADPSDAKPASPAAAPVASSAPSASPDASKSPQSL